MGQKELAEIAGVSHAALHRIERQDSSPRLATVEAIEAVLRDLGIKFAVDEDGSHAMYFSSELIDKLAAKQESGEAVTSRGKIGGRPRKKQK